MSSHLLKPLTLAALGALLVTAPSARGFTDAAVDRPAAPAAASSTTLHLGALPVGAKPGIAYIRGRHLDVEVGDYRLRRPDGTTLHLPRGTWVDWAPMGRGQPAPSGMWKPSGRRLWKTCDSRLRTLSPVAGG
jgi:hypothetical protein